MGRTRSACEATCECRILLVKPRWNMPLRRHARKWEDNIKTYLGETWYETTDWIEVLLDSVCFQASVNMVLYIRV